MLGKPARRECFCCDTGEPVPARCACEKQRCEWCGFCSGHCQCADRDIEDEPTGLEDE